MGYTWNGLLNYIRVTERPINYDFMTKVINRTIDITALPCEFNGITSIGSYAFAYCTNLALTSLPESLTSIDNYAFNNCTNLALTSLPENLTSIGNYAFHGCTSLTSLTFKGTPTSISVDAFRYCNNLKTINVPWAEGAVANAPWGATNATINYNYKGE